jgi:Raf kinase inhibitor-like YbhB/YbcL family protein
MRKKLQLALTIILLVSSPAGNLRAERGGAVSFALKTTAFSERGTIPKKYTCDGADVSPGLTWTGAPSGTRSFALIADDPDAPVGTWTHWVIWDIPPEQALPEGVPKTETLSDGTRQGRNSFRRIGYGGPCPPPGRPHRYFFRLYSLDSRLDVGPGAGRTEVERAIKGHILAQAELMGRYGR